MLSNTKCSSSWVWLGYQISSNFVLLWYSTPTLLGHLQAGADKDSNSLPAHFTNKSFYLSCTSISSLRGTVRNPHAFSSLCSSLKIISFVPFCKHLDLHTVYVKKVVWLMMNVKWIQGENKLAKMLYLINTKFLLL